MTKYDQSTLVNKFDPESNDYDYQTALDAGGGANEEGHWSSLDPRTGLVLKGRDHETWDLMMDEEDRLGNSVVKGDDGRYYSVQGNKYSSSTPVLDGGEDTVDNFAARAKRDYGFSMENNVEFGFGDAIRHEWGSLNAVQKKIPFVGGMLSVFENVEMVDTARRLRENTYEQSWYEELGLEEQRGEFFMDVSEGAKERFMETAQKADKEAISAYLKYVTSEKTFLAKVATGASQLPTWFLEFAATGGLASLGDDVATKAGEKLLQGYAKTAAGKVALRTAGWSAGAFTRTYGLSHQVGEKFTKDTLDEVLRLSEDTGWGTKLARAWGDVYIESLSEALFGGPGTASLIDEGLIVKGLAKLPLGKKFIPALQKTWMKATKGTKAQFIKKMTSKGGYSNILGEIGEERLGTTLRAIANVDDFGLGEDSTWLERLKSGTIQDIENIWVEIGVLSFPAATQFVAGKVLDRGKADRIRTEIGAKSDEIAKQEQSAQEIRGMIDAKVGQEGVFEGIVEAAAEAGDTGAVTEAVAAAPVAEPAPEGVTAPEPTAKPEGSIEKGISLDRAEQLTGQKKPTAFAIRQSFNKMNRVEQVGVIENVKAELQELQDDKKSLLQQRKEAFTPDKPLFTQKIKDIGKRIVGKQEGLERFEKSLKPEILLTEQELLVQNKIRPKERGIGKGEFWEYKDKDGTWTVAPTKAEAIKRTNLAQPPTAKPAEKSDIKQTAPTRVEDANLNDEVDNTVGQLMTDRADPSKTSLRQEDVQEGRKILGLDGVPSEARKSQLKDLQTAKDGGYVEEAEDNADRALNGGDPLNRVESAGALVRMVQLLNKYKAKKALLANAKESLAIVSLNAEMERIVKRYDALSMAVHRSGSEAGRRLAMQKLTIDENYDYLSVTTRVKARRGKEPTQKQAEKLKKLTDELEQKDREIARLQKEVAEAMAKDFLRKGKVARYKEMNRAEVLSERESLTSKITALLDEGC